MQNTNYPFKAWITQPSGKAVELTIIGKPKWMSDTYPIVVTDKDKHIMRNELYETKSQALDARMTKLKAQEARLKKQVAVMKKRMANVTAQLQAEWEG